VIPREWPISIVLFSMMIVGAFFMMSNVYGNYDVTPLDMPDSFDKIAEINEQASAMQTKLEASGASPIGFLEYISTGAWQSLKLITNTIPLTAGIVEETGQQFGVPRFFIFGFLTLVTISIVFGIISAVFRRKA